MCSRIRKVGLITTFYLTLLPAMSLAEACDYRPSALVGGGTASAVAVTGGAVSSAGVALPAAGFYTLTHATTGLTMLASTGGGASAAGTVGIIGGTGGLIGSAAAFLSAPVTVVVGAVAAVGIGGYEAICYFQDERVTDFDAVYSAVAEVALYANPEMFRLDTPPESKEAARIFIRNGEGEFDVYDVEDLYIVNGVLYNRDWFRNTQIGSLTFVQIAAEAGAAPDGD